MGERETRGGLRGGERLFIYLERCGYTHVFPLVFDQDFSFGGVFLWHIEELIDANKLLCVRRVFSYRFTCC